MSQEINLSKTKADKRLDYRKKKKGLNRLDIKLFCPPENLLFSAASGLEEATYRPFLSIEK